MKNNSLSIALLSSAFIVGVKAQTPQRPNIIYIFTDQQSPSMMSCAGNKYLNTPAMDYIAAHGVRFTRAYCTNPVSSPSRVSMITGRMCGEFTGANGEQARENEVAFRIPKLSDQVLKTTIPAYLQQADYDLYYGGKSHLPPPLKPSSLGFKMIGGGEREELAVEAANVIRQKHNRPYYMTLSFINPHDICFMALRDFTTSENEKRMIARSKKETEALDEALKLPSGVSENEFFARWCPPLPLNFEPQEDEPKAIQHLLEIRDFRIGARKNYTEKDWRMHRWAYCRLTELVDRQIQVVLDAIRESGNEENTLIIFSSDHGDMDAAHRMEHKTALYEESIGVPMMVMWKGTIPGGRVDDRHLVSVGLDLLPTVCDYAGVRGVADPRGRSLRPLLEQKETKWRESLGIETEIGRMVLRQDGLKYTKHDAVGIEEHLYDLKRDPGEMKNFAKDRKYKRSMEQMRALFSKEWFPGY